MSEPDRFQEAVRRALENDFLQVALARATRSFKVFRERGVGQVDGFERLRQRARAAKDRVLGRLDEYLSRLEDSLSRAGVRVFWASKGQEAVDYILALAQERGLKRVVKGKSMTTEEIELNPQLERAGLEVWETDLGEYIIQLAGQRPSHIIGPAIHKTKEEVGRLFAEKLGLAYTERPEEMTQAARRELRSRFLSADLGITGVNFAVAETGTLVLLENEGNIRMTTTWPRVHVALMGLEKVVADLEDLAVLLKILPLSATGQFLPTYVSFLTGPGREEGVGPEEVHLVILDGYRSRLLADPELRPALRCLRCGACLNYCPVYRRIGGHAYPWTISGPIGVALTAAAQGLEAASEIAQASTLCHTCGQVCPVMIDLPGIILELRRRAAEQGPALLDRGLNAAARCLATPLGFDLTGRALGTAARVMIDPQGRVRRAPAAVQAAGAGRRLPRPAQEPFHRSLFRGDEE